jgi:hypothetical protein
MKELILWKEVGLGLKPEDASDNDWKLIHRKDEKLWLKRVVVNILSDQEIKNAASIKDCPKVIPPESFSGLGNPNADYYDRERQFWIKGYKAMQERILGGEGL